MSEPTSAKSVISRYSAACLRQDVEGGPGGPNRSAFRNVVSKDRIKAVLQQKQYEQAACLSLPFTTVFFVFYMLMVLTHEDVYTIYRTEKAIRNLVESVTCEGSEYKLGDAIVPLDIWRWFESSVVCTDSEWFQQMDSRGNTLPRKEWARVLGANRLYGGILLEQSRTQRTECAVDLPYAWDCYAKEDDRLPEDSVFGLWHANQSSLPEEYANKLYYENEGFRPWSSIHFDNKTRLLSKGGRPEMSVHESNERIWDIQMPRKGERFPFFFLEQESLANLKTRLSYLSGGAWIDDQTDLIMLKANLVNAEVKLSTHVTVLFRFGRPGGMDVAVRLQSSPLSIYKNATGPFFDAMWLIMLCSILSSLLKDFRSAKVKGVLTPFIRSIWTWIDILTVVFGFLIILGFAVRQEANHRFMSSMSAVDFNRAIDQQYLQELRHMHQLADSIDRGTMWYRILLGDYVLLLMLRFFKAFRAQPRLALVTTTIAATASDLLHFAIVYLSIFLSFAYASVVLFGRRIGGFSSFWQAVASCWAIICGDVNWKEISLEHPVTAAVWFCSFMLLTYFVLLNMVLAVVVEVYTEIRGQVVLGDTLFIQCKKAFMNVWHQGFRQLYVSQKENRQLIRDLDQLGDEISKEEIIRRCPMKSEKQINSLLYEARAIGSTTTETRGISFVEAMRLIGEMSKEVSQIRRTVSQFKTGKCWCHMQRAVEIQIKARSRRAHKARNILIGALRSGELGAMLRRIRKEKSCSGSMTESSTRRPQPRQPKPLVSSNGLKAASMVSESMPADFLTTLTCAVREAVCSEFRVLKEDALNQGTQWKDTRQADICTSLTSAVREAVGSEFQIQAQALKADVHDWAVQLKESVRRDIREVFKHREIQKPRSREVAQGPSGNETPNQKKARHIQTRVELMPQLGMTSLSSPLSPPFSTLPSSSYLSRPVSPSLHLSPTNLAEVSPHQPESIDAHASRMPVPDSGPFVAGPSIVAETLEPMYSNMAAAETQQYYNTTKSTTEHNTDHAYVAIRQHDASRVAQAHSASRSTNNVQRSSSSVQEVLTDEGLQIYEDQSDPNHISPFDQALSFKHSRIGEMNPSRQQSSSSVDSSCRARASDWHPQRHIVMNDQSEQFARASSSSPTRSASQVNQNQLVLVSPQSLHQPEAQQVNAPVQVVRSRPHTGRQRGPFIDEGSAHAVPGEIYLVDGERPPSPTYFVRVALLGAHGSTGLPDMLC